MRSGGSGAGRHAEGGRAGGVIGVKAFTRAGISAIVMPRAAEAEAAVPRGKERDAITVVAAEEAGTAMLAVMITLAAATLIVTSDASTPAAVAMFCCKVEVSE